MEINKLAAKLGLSRAEVRRAARADRLRSFMRLLGRKPMRKAMPREPKPGASTAENQAYEDAMEPFVAWQAKFDGYVEQWKVQRADTYRDPNKAARKKMARERWEAHSRIAKRYRRIRARASKALRGSLSRLGVDRREVGKVVI